MTPEEKQLLLIDLCARLPYQPICKFTDTEDVVYTATAALGYSLCDFIAGKTLIEPYLRSMESMTEEEFKEYDNATDLDVSDSSETLKVNLAAKSRVRVSKWYHGTDWLNAHHFDYRGLIEKGLALEAPEGMYKTE